MRAHALREYASAVEALREPGCPVCTLLRNEQNRVLRDCPLPTTRLCNFHAWGIAAVGDTAHAARILLKLLESGEGAPHGAEDDCMFCLLLRAKEQSVIRDLTSVRHQSAVVLWLKTRGSFCLVHGRRVRAKASLPMSALITESDFRRRTELKTALARLAAAPAGSPHSGVLGQTAEYLVSQRGLPT